MKLSEQDKLLIHKYIKDSLSDEEQRIFNNRSKDKDFRKELLRQITVLKSIHDQNKENITNALNEIELSDTKTSSNSNALLSNTLKKIILYTIGLGMLIVLSYTTIKFLNVQEPNNSQQYAEVLLKESLKQTHFYSTSRSLEKGGDDKKYIADSVNDALSNKKDDEVINILESRDSLTDEEKYIIAEAMLRLSKYSEAIEYLSQIIEDGKDYKIEALWRRALVYGILKENENMKSDLTALKQQSNYQSEKIENLLSK